MATLNCPSCAGSIEGISPHIRSIDCSYCGSWLCLNNQLWEAKAGQKVALNAPSFLRVGQYGSLPNGDNYTVVGRIRLQYEQDSWDEWWVEDGYGKGFWLEEDDGAYYRHTNQQNIEFNNKSIVSDVGVGEDLTLNNGLTLFITEKFEATITGREGFLPTEPETNTIVSYLDGVSDGIEYSLEIEGNQASLSQAEVFDVHAIRWDKL